MNIPLSFAELKRRNVYKVAVAYAVVAWLLIQVAWIILPNFEAPAWTMKVVIAASAVGFPHPRFKAIVEGSEPKTIYY